MWESRYDYELSWNLAELAEKVGFGDADRFNETTIHGLHRWLIEDWKIPIWLLLQY